jgi:hypothetical protein
VLVRARAAADSLQYRINSRYPPLDQFKLTSGSFEEFTVYKFHKKIATHYICPTCGVALVSEVEGAMVVNVASVDGVDLKALRLKHFDGATLL